MGEPRTQKAKGIVALAEAGLSVPWFRVIADADDIPDAIKFLRYRAVTYAFARPCPSRPRHGFVESRPVNLTNPEAAAEIAMLLDLARHFDPQAEIVLMNYVPAAYNAIVTPGAVVIGPGEDGATAGVNAVTIPWIGFDPEHPRNAAIIEAIEHADVRESPYFEFVITRNALTSAFSEAEAVQLRDGPRVSATSSDFIPRRIVVGRVLTISDPQELDLLAWEDVVRELSPDSDVVYFPGGSLASHAAVHCVARGIAVVTSHEPKIGEVLEPHTDSTYDLNRFLLGLEHGLVVPLNVFDHENIRAARLGLYVLHNAAAMVGQHTYYIGLSAGILVRTGLALILGELRHHPLGVELLSSLGFYPAEREYVYEFVLGKYSNFLKALSLVPAALDLFRYAEWRESYGGPAWYSCGERWFRLASAVAAFITNPSREVFGTVLQALNDMVNEAHNNGWWFNKVLSESEFDFAAANHPRFAAAAAVFAHEISQKDIPVVANALARFCEALPVPSQIEPSLCFEPPLVVDEVCVSVDFQRVVMVFKAHDKDGVSRFRGSIKHAARAEALRSMLKQEGIESLVVPVTQNGYYVQFQVGEYHVFGTVDPKVYAFEWSDDDCEQEDEDSCDD